MPENKQNHMHPGALKSCLIPFTDQIFDWWYDDHLSVAEIRRRLIKQGLEVSESTISRFIKVRERRALARKRPDALKKKRTPKKKLLITETETLQEKKSPETEPQISTKASITEVSRPDMERPTPKEAEEAEELLRHLRETSPQQLWREEYEAKMKK